jgi:hypothetical protein
VLDRVCVVRERCLEEPLKVVYRRQRLALDTASSGCDALHVGDVHLFVIVVVIVGCGCDPLRALLSPLLATLDILLGALDGDVAWRRLAGTRDRFPAA